MVTNLRLKNSTAATNKYSEWTISNDDSQITHTTKMPVVNLNAESKRFNSNSNSNKLKFIQTIENEMGDGEFEVYGDDFEDDGGEEQEEQQQLKKRREKKSMKMKEAYKPILPNDIYKQYYGSKFITSNFNSH